MKVGELLVEAFDRVHGVVHGAVEGLTAEQLGTRVDGQANSIAWLVWHLTRIQDDHLADVAGTEQVWTAGGWAERFALPLDDSETGYGHSDEAVGSVQVDSGELLTDYYDAVHQQTLRFVSRLVDADLDRIVDESYQPAVTLGARLVSVISDDLQHAGQAALVRGIVSAQPLLRPTA